MLRSLSLLAAALSLSGHIHAADTAPSRESDDVATIRQVVEQFRTAIIARDGKAVEAIFAPGEDHWVTVYNVASLAEARARNPAAPRLKPTSLRGFAAFLGKVAVPVEEVFHDVRIHTDGALAVVYFDFDFLTNGKVTDHGAETWQMVRTDAGWKISSMLYSTR